ncbi:hypothetical protein [Cellulosimicrobium cellulans]|uniref:hypothetical protein n=1 Tax=Cellulosimicrobium cellulans TaxID=1710 RepID=UPI00130DC2DE|nr:hypothetical protein [Cellulosimicrobium cellulans]
MADQQVDPAYNCELVQRSAAWDQAAQPHQLHVVLDVRYTYPPGVYVLPSDRQVRFSTSLEVPGQPDWWTWDEAVVDASTDPAPTQTTACADLPHVAGTLPPGYQWGTHWLVTMTPGPGGSLCR